MPAKSVGYIGLGNAGYYLAAGVAKAGFQMVVDDADQERVQKFVNEFHGTQSSGDDGFKDVDVLVTMLPNGQVVRDVLLGEKGIAKQLKPGQSTQSKAKR
jgi:3-hydroxyisobutyrate dehydrogenase-like beta-hydroxyacid dehydrogenase